MSVSIMEGIQAQMQYDCCSNTKLCWCGGSGWVVSDWDSQHKCPYHYKGQPNNEDDELTWDIWWYNTNGNGQFMVIPDPGNAAGIKEYAIQWHLKYVANTTKEDEDVPF